MPDQQFSLVQFTNRNGSKSWRVSGWLAGVRIRRNFQDRKDAVAEKLALEIKAAQFASNIRQASTFLTDEELRDAEGAMQRIKGKPHGLTFYVDFALANYREPSTRQTLAAALDAYLTAKRREHAQRHLSIRQLWSIERELKSLTVHFPSALVADFTPAKLSAYLERGNASLKTCNNRRAIVGTFLKFAFQRDWIESNPMAKIPHRRIIRFRGAAQTLTAQQAAELMAYVEQYANGALVPMFALSLFAGIRPSIPDGEIGRLQPDRVCLDQGIVHIDAEVSKVRMKRQIAILPNLAAWLRAYPLDQFPIVPRNAKNYREKIFGRFELTHDVMRHTFISMHVAKFRSLGEAALQAGNSEAIIRKHYLDLKSKEEAEALFAIVPKHRAVTNAAPVPVPFQLPDHPPGHAKAG